MSPVCFVTEVLSTLRGAAPIARRKGSPQSSALRLCRPPLRFALSVPPAAPSPRVEIPGYLNQIRSSRRLEAECRRNVELMWLLGRLYPDYKSIAEFRRMHREAVTAAGAELVQFARSCGLIRWRVDRHRWHEVPRRGQCRQRARAPGAAEVSGQHGEGRRGAAGRDRSICGAGSAGEAEAASGTGGRLHEGRRDHRPGL